MAATPTIDEGRLEAFMGRFVQDFGAGATIPLVLIGDKLGLYKAMADGEPVTPAELAERTGCRERYIREWLSQQAASGYMEYADGHFTLPPEQALALAHDDSPVFIPGAFQLLAAIVKDEPHVTERFRSGEGMAWGDHHHDLFEGTERFFRPGYTANLTSSWLPSLEGVVEKLEAGARVADIGCGHGASTILMAQAYPRSTFIGSDNHEGSIQAAREAAARAGVADRVTFEVATAANFGGGPYDLDLRLRRPARHGRPRRRGPARALAAGATAAPGSSSSPTPATRSRTTSTPSGARSTRPRRCSARRTRSARRSGSRSARRRASSG